MKSPLQKQAENLVTLITDNVLPILYSDKPDKTERITKALDKILEVMLPIFTDLANKLVTTNIDTIIDKISLDYRQDGFSIYHHSQRTQDVIKSILEGNLDLITSIPTDIITKSRQTLLQSIASFDRASITRELRAITNLANRRIELIARDQTAKAVTAYDRALAQDMGFTHYIWSTSDDERVSTGEGGHKYLDNRIYSYTEPTAIIDDDGNKGHPGQRINCRCTQDPIRLSQGERLVLTKDKRRGDYYVITR